METVLKTVWLSEKDRSAIGVMFAVEDGKSWDDLELASSIKKKLKLKTLEQHLKQKTKQDPEHEMSEDVGEFLLEVGQHSFLVKHLNDWVGTGKVRCASADQLLALRSHLEAAKDTKVEPKADEAKKD